MFLASFSVILSLWLSSKERGGGGGRAKRLSSVLLSVLKIIAPPEVLPSRIQPTCPGHVTSLAAFKGNYFNWVHCYLGQNWGSDDKEEVQGRGSEQHLPQGATCHLSNPVLGDP